MELWDDTKYTNDNSISIYDIIAQTLAELLVFVNRDFLSLAVLDLIACGGWDGLRLTWADCSKAYLIYVSTSLR